MRESSKNYIISLAKTIYKELSLMNILSLFQAFVNHLNNFLKDSICLHDLESEINFSTNQLNLETLKTILESIDLEYKNSKARKEIYYIQATKERTLITSPGLITFNKTYYRSKKKENDKYIFYSYLEDYLGINKWAKMTLSAITKLVNNAIENGMSWAAKNTIPGYITTRQTISVKVKDINYNLKEDIIKVHETPEILYIEADEVHANLQRKNKFQGKKKNRIVPVILTHEGHKENFVKKKELKNTHYIASSILKTEKLWNETYKYLDLRYNLTQIKYLFISGDGASWIKQYLEAFPNAIYVLDKFHYRKSLNYVFKKASINTELADHYLRHRMINEFKILVKHQINNFPHQRKYMIQKQNYLINNIDGIINQKHPMYKCPASMEGHISNKYARFITSRPHAFSEDGLENIVQLLTMKANNISLTEELYHQFKYGNNTYKELNLEKFVSKFKVQAKYLINNEHKYLNSTTVYNQSFSPKDNYRLDFYLNKRL